jgi:serine/threonine protein kinase
MNPERWQAVGKLFEGALAVATSERQVWVERASEGDAELQREVSSLLASHSASPGGFVQDKIKNVLASFQEANFDPQNAKVGAYRLVRELGRGGMGTVFLAERNDDEYHAQVAIKLVRPGMDTEFILTRFRRERQTLARLQHPNIAQLFDGGTTSKGIPYIVMEYIDGPSLTSYAKEKNLSIPGRLRLFIGICSAVDYAHRNFVVHRDIKPGNILVAPGGVPKLLDFGVCKLLREDAGSSETAAGLLTPAYASPEQVRGGAVTPLSDIYSLGVVLYQLLTGVLPTRENVGHAYGRAPILAASKAVKDRRLSRQLSGNLDNIVARALEFEPQRRYPWAAQLSEDLQRHLTNRPVHAGPSTWRYRASTFVRRNWYGVASLSVVVFLVLLAGLTIAIHKDRAPGEPIAKTQKLANQVDTPSRDISLDIYQSLLKQREGDAFAASGKLADAKKAYLESANGAEPCMRKCQAACVLIFIQSNRRLAQNAVALGRREDALEFAQRALQTGESAPPEAVSAFPLPRSYAAMGLTFTALDKSPVRAAGDRRQAQTWLYKSLLAWHKAQPDAGFSVNDQQEIKEVEAALQGIGH